MPSFAPAARSAQLPLKNARSPAAEPTRQPLTFAPRLSIVCSILAEAARIASPTAAFISGERVSGRLVLLGAIPIRANSSRSGFSAAAAPTGGQNCRRKLRYSPNFVVNASGSNCGQLIVGAGGGAGLPRKAESGCTL